MFDLGPAFASIIGTAESQLAEGGYNASNDCVPAAFSDCLQALGLPDFEPQGWVDQEYDKAYRGYTALDRMMTEARRHFGAACPPMDIANPASNWDYVNAAGAAGHPCAVLFHIDSSVSIGRGRSGYHCSVPIACDGTYMTVLNVWHGTLQRLNLADYADATSGSNAGTTVQFLAPVKVPTPEDPDAMTPDLRAELDNIKAQAANDREQLTAADALIFALAVNHWNPANPAVYAAIEAWTKAGVRDGSFANLLHTVQLYPAIGAAVDKEAAEQAAAGGGLAVGDATPSDHTGAMVNELTYPGPPGLALAAPAIEPSNPTPTGAATP